VAAEQIFRVLVRGRFNELGESARNALVASLDEHDVSRAAFTPEGTLTYDARIDAFSFRYEIRIGPELPDGTAARLGVREAEMFLDAMGLGHGELGASATDMADVWAKR
jgi:hypothetical protein